MKVVYHGGLCCGIRQIYGMGQTPADMVGALAYDGSNVPFRGAAPKEDKKTRLRRYVLGLEKKYPEGIIEVVVMRPNGWTGVKEGATSPVYWQLQYSQADSWQPVLEEFGFKLVNKSKNSNSKNTVFVYHRNSGGEGVVALEPLEPYPPVEALPKGKKRVPSCGVDGCTQCGYNIVNDPDYVADDDEEGED